MVKGSNFQERFIKDLWNSLWTSGARRKFSRGRISFRVIWWSFVFGVRGLWRHNLTSFSCFQTNVLAKFG